MKNIKKTTIGKMKEIKMSESYFLEKMINCKFRYLATKLDNMKPEMKKVIPNWERLNEIEILESFSIKEYIEGTVYLINDSSFIYDVIFEFDVLSILELPTAYPPKYKGGIFNGDTSFISPETMNLIDFHHDGILFLYKIPLLGGSVSD
jgi:hypothetical protein